MDEGCVPRIQTENDRENAPRKIKTAIRSICADLLGNAAILMWKTECCHSNVLPHTVTKLTIVP